MWQPVLQFHNEYCLYFANKVDAIRRAIEDLSPPDYTPIIVAVHFPEHNG